MSGGRRRRLSGKGRGCERGFRHVPGWPPGELPRDGHPESCRLCLRGTSEIRLQLRAGERRTGDIVRIPNRNGALNHHFGIVEFWPGCNSVSAGALRTFGVNIDTANDIILVVRGAAFKPTCFTTDFNRPRSLSETRWLRIARSAPAALVGVSASWKKALYLAGTNSPKLGLIIGRPLLNEIVDSRSHRKCV
jgi:hypothetical protein